VADAQNRRSSSSVAQLNTILGDDWGRHRPRYHLSVATRTIHAAVYQRLELFDITSIARDAICQ
jgi:hypothetical protein